MIGLISKFLPLAFALVSLISIAVVLSGCTSTSSPSDLYFIKINLSDFPKLGSLELRRSPSISDPTGVSLDITTAAGSAADAVQTGASEASNAITTAADQTNDQLQHLREKLKSDLPGFYSVGSLGYCTGEHAKLEYCSKPTASFYFDLAGIFKNISAEITDVIPGLNAVALTGYKKASQWSIAGFIVGLVLTVVAMVLSLTNLRLILALVAVLSTLSITGACIGVSVIYGTLAAAIKSILGPFGAHASLSPQIFTAAWLSAGFSITSTLTWLIVVFCCCI